MEKKITLFHGSEKVIEHPVFGEGKKHNDFGLGFYCTESEFESFCLPDSVQVHYTDGVIPYLLAQKVARKSCVVICCMDFPYTVGLTTLVEAFALGIPVICSRNPNFEMDIDKEEIGITVAYNDVEGWINAIHRIADHPEEAQKMGANARKLAEKRFNLEIFSHEIAESLLEISKMSSKKRTFA